MNQDVVDELRIENTEYIAQLEKLQKEFDELELSFKKAQVEANVEKITWEHERTLLEEKVVAANSKDEKILACCKRLFKKFQDVRATLEEVRSLKIDELEEMNKSFPEVGEVLNGVLEFNAKLVK